MAGGQAGVVPAQGGQAQVGEAGDEGDVEPLDGVEQASLAGLGQPHRVVDLGEGGVDADLAFGKEAVEGRGDAALIPVGPHCQRLGLFEGEVELGVAVEDPHLAEDHLPEQRRRGRGERFDVGVTEGEGGCVLVWFEGDGSDQMGDPVAGVGGDVGGQSGLDAFDELDETVVPRVEAGIRYSESTSKYR